MKQVRQLAFSSVRHCASWRQNPHFLANSKYNTAVASNQGSGENILTLKHQKPVASPQPANKTALHSLHIEFGGKMVKFAGWALPVLYEHEGIMSSHLHARSHAALFDVSHMGQLIFYGKDRVDFIESLVPGDIKSLLPGEMRLTLLTTNTGTIIDDTIVTAHKLFLSMVVNAGCREKDIEHVSGHLQKAKLEGMDVDMKLLDTHSLIALQGPESMLALQSIVPADFNLEKMSFMTSKLTTLDGISDCTVSRCGYTGEDGFEISIPSISVEQVVRKLLSHPSVKLAGLGARDTLRLESGFCLYGHDISEETTVVEAGLAWTVGKRRRIDGNFPGSDIILGQLKNGVSQKRVGILISDKSPAKEGARLQNRSGEEIGRITSSVFSPSLQRPIAMGYLQKPYIRVGTEVVVDVRGKVRSGEVVKMPFVPASFYKIP